MKSKKFQPKEKNRLEKIASWYNPQNKNRSVENIHINYLSDVLIPILRGPRVLEMGCSTGVMTKRLVKKFPNLTVIDGSKEYIEYTKNLVKANNARFIVSLFEDFETQKKFDDIIISHALEHVGDPVFILKKAKSWLKKDGKIHIMLPSAQSLHRRIGQKMGVIKNLEDLTEKERKIGHRRVYSRESLKKDVEKAGLKIIFQQSIFLKPLSASQMQNWDEKILYALFEIGKELPEYCATLYFVCKKI